MDGGAWWAAVYGVPQSLTQLKRLSRGSSKQVKSEIKITIPFVLVPSQQNCCAQSLSRVCQAPLLMGILQARILEWVAMPSSRESS